MFGAERAFTIHGMDWADEDFPWPRSGDDPFSVDEATPQTAAATSFGAGASAFGRYADGYKSAADILVETVAWSGF